MKITNLLKLITVLVVSCNQSSSNQSEIESHRRIQTTSSSAATNNQEDLNGQDSQEIDEQDSNSTQESQLSEIDFLILPQMASVSIKSTPELKPSTFVKGIFVPRVQIAYTRSDYVKILRCKESTSITTVLGDDLKESTSGITSEEGTSAWRRAVEQEKQCKVVATKFSQPYFIDDTTPKGKFFYIFNPCIGVDRSILGSEGCSGKIKLSKVVDAPQSISEALKIKRRELNEAEAELAEVLGRTYFLSKRIAQALEACESKVSNDKARVNVLKGMISLGTFLAAFTVGAVAGSIVPNPLGPVNAGLMLGGIAGQMLPAMVIFPEAGIEDEIQNECINPYVKETNKASRDKLCSDEKTKDVDGLRNSCKSGGKYEEQYQVQNLWSAFKAIGTPGGSLEKALDKLRQQMNQSFADEICVSEWNNVIQNFKDKGFDPKDATVENLPGYAKEIKEGTEDQESSLSLTEGSIDNNCLEL